MQYLKEIKLSLFNIYFWSFKKYRDSFWSPCLYGLVPYLHRIWTRVPYLYRIWTRVANQRSCIKTTQAKPLEQVVQYRWGGFTHTREKKKRFNGMTQILIQEILLKYHGCSIWLYLFKLIYTSRIFLFFGCQWKFFLRTVKLF